MIMPKKKGSMPEMKAARKRPKSNSGVTTSQLKFWSEKYVWGDYQKIKKATGLSRPTIKLAFDGDSTSSVAEQITNYYLKH
jgi:hypothetical protein